MLTNKIRTIRLSMVACGVSLAIPGLAVPVARRAQARKRGMPTPKVAAAARPVWETHEGTPDHLMRQGALRDPKAFFHAFVCEVPSRAIRQAQAPKNDRRQETGSGASECGLVFFLRSGPPRPSVLLLSSRCRRPARTCFLSVAGIFFFPRSSLPVRS